MSQEHCKWEKFMSVLIFKTTSLLSDLNGGKVVIADYLPDPPPPKKNKQTKNKTNKQKTRIYMYVQFLLSTLICNPCRVKLHYA